MDFLEFIKPNRKKIIIFIILVVLFSVTLRLSLGTYPFWHVPVSNAMAPSYSKGDLVFVKATSYDEISIGDVIVHEVPEKNWRWIMRVDSKNDISRTYTTKGDNNPDIIQIQKDLPEVTIVSKVVGKMPYIGYLDIFRVGWLFRIVLVYVLSSFLAMIIKKK